MPTLELSKTSQRAFEQMAADLARIFGPRLVALVAFGPAASMAFIRTLSSQDLDACAALVEAWRRDGLAPPLVMTPEEFRRSLDAFPLEYTAMLDAHAVIVGDDPFAGVAIRPEDVRRACEVQARGLLIHLRQGWLQAAGHASHLADLVEASSGPLRQTLLHVARLEGVRADSDDALTTFAAERLALPGGLIKAVLALGDAPESARQLAGRLPEYLAAAEQLWSFVDGWRSR